MSLTAHGAMLKQANADPLLQALWVLLFVVWFCALQLTAGFFPPALAGQEHDGLQQSQKRVVNPAVPVVGGLHGGGGGAPELLLELLLDPPGLPELLPELLDALGFPLLLELLEELAGRPEELDEDAACPLELPDVPESPEPLGFPELEDPPDPLLDPPLTGRPELEPVLDDGGLPLASSVPPSSGAVEEEPLQAKTAPPAHTTAETMRRRSSEVLWGDVYMWVGK